MYMCHVHRSFDLCPRSPRAVFLWAWRLLGEEQMPGSPPETSGGDPAATAAPLITVTTGCGRAPPTVADAGPRCQCCGLGYRCRLGADNLADVDADEVGFQTLVVNLLHCNPPRMYPHGHPFMVPYPKFLSIAKNVLKCMGFKAGARRAPASLLHVECLSETKCFCTNRCVVRKFGVILYERVCLITRRLY